MLQFINYDPSVETLSTVYIPIPFLENYQGYINDKQQNMFVCTLFAKLRSQGATNSFYYPQKIPTQINLPKKNTCQIFVSKQIPESKISNPKKFL